MSQHWNPPPAYTSRPARTQQRQRGSKGPVQRAAFRLLVVVWVMLMIWTYVVLDLNGQAREDMFCREAAKTLNQPVEEHC